MINASTPHLQRVQRSGRNSVQPAAAAVVLGRIQLRKDVDEGLLRARQLRLRLSLVVCLVAPVVAIAAV
jgi:hypothetical protein